MEGPKITVTNEGKQLLVTVGDDAGCAVRRYEGYEEACVGYDSCSLADMREAIRVFDEEIDKERSASVESAISELSKKIEDGWK